MTDFDPNFALYHQAETFVEVLSGRVDGYPEEEHTMEVRATQNPVESGSTLTDNVVKLRDQLKLEGWTSDILPANRAAAASPDRAADTWQHIEQLMRAREPVTVVTGIKTYTNMLVQKVTVPRDVKTGASLRFRIELIEMLFADTSIARYSPDRVDSLGPAALRTSQVDGGDRAAPRIDVPTSFFDTIDETLKRPKNFLDRVGGVLKRVDDFANRADSLIREAGWIAQRIPLSLDVNQTFRTILGGQSVRVSSWYQPLDESWYTTLSNLDRTPISASMRLLEQGRPMRGYVGDFNGELYIMGTTEVSRESLGETNSLVYLTA